MEGARLHPHTTSCIYRVEEQNRLQIVVRFRTADEGQVAGQAGVGTEGRESRPILRVQEHLGTDAPTATSQASLGRGRKFGYGRSGGRPAR